MKNLTLAIRTFGISALIVILLTSLSVSAVNKNNSIVHIKEVYKIIDTLNLEVDIFYSVETLEKTNNAAIVFFHGGGWAYGSPHEFFTTCQHYAKLGIVCFSVDYRLSIENGVVPHKTISPIECLMDAKSAFRWVRENAKKWHVDENKIVACGQSAGGHLAISTAVIDSFNEQSDNIAISCVPNAVMLFSATVNCIEQWCDRLLADRRNQIWNLSPAHNLKADLPPMVHFHGTDDQMVPYWSVSLFDEETRKLGNYFELHTFKNRRHYLGDGNPKYSRYFDDEILEVADEFLRKFNFLD